MVMEKKLKLEQIAGCLLGGAVGDALGAPIEFMSSNEILRDYGILGVTDYVEYKDGAGEFTDDTQMTLFTAEGLLLFDSSIILKDSDDALLWGIYESYQRWLHTQCYNNNYLLTNNEDFDINKGWLIKRKELFSRRAPGNTCLSSLIGGVPGSFENPINNSKGCGGVMRVAPVGLIFSDDYNYSFHIAAKIAALTHGHPSGYLSAGFLSSLLSLLTIGSTLVEAINKTSIILKTYIHFEETLQTIEKAVYLAQNFDNEKNDFISTSKLIESIGLGWTGEEALAISLFCSIIYQKDFKKGVIAAVNHSGDSDSTGSITGNILGLINGVEGIPENWTKNLKFNDIVLQIANDIYIKKLFSKSKDI